jgi:hypothetical protein
MCNWGWRSLSTASSRQDAQGGGVTRELGGGIVLLRVDQVALFYEGRQQLSLLLFGWKMRTKQVKSADFAEFERSSTEMQTTIYKAKAFVV